MRGFNRLIMRLGLQWRRYSMVALLLGVMACSQPQIQVRESEHMDPVIKKDRFVADDGKALPLRQWQPKSKPRAIVIAIHGFNDYSKAFEGAGEYLRAQNMMVLAYDQRGFGANDQRGIWPGVDNLIKDVQQLVLAARKKFPKTPIYLLGESMGAAVAIQATVAYPETKVDGLILSAPAVWGGETLNWLYRSVLWMMVHTFPSSEVTGRVIGVVATDNEDILREMGQDPLVIKSTRVDAIHGIVQLMDVAHQSIPQISVPALILYGEHDQVIPRRPVVQMVGNMASPTVAAYYPEGYHLLLRDLQAETVLEDVASWIKNPRKPLPSGSDEGTKEQWQSWAE